jgi:copper chaperone CopZ
MLTNGGIIMGNVIIVLILVVIAVVAVRSYSKKLTQGCCGAGGDSNKKVRVRDKNPDHYPYTVTIGVEGMTCKHCKQRVENALNEEEGVWAEVDLENHSALVRMKKPVSEERLRRVITQAGYTPAN